MTPDSSPAGVGALLRNDNENKTVIVATGLFTQRQVIRVQRLRKSFWLWGHQETSSPVSKAQRDLKLLFESSNHVMRQIKYQSVGMLWDASSTLWYLLSSDRESGRDFNWNIFSCGVRNHTNQKLVESCGCWLSFQSIVKKRIHAPWRHVVIITLITIMEFYTERWRSIKFMTWKQQTR